MSKYSIYKPMEMYLISHKHMTLQNVKLDYFKLYRQTIYSTCLRT